MNEIKLFEIEPTQILEAVKAVMELITFLSDKGIIGIISVVIVYKLYKARKGQNKSNIFLRILEVIHEGLKKVKDIIIEYYEIKDLVKERKNSPTEAAAKEEEKNKDDKNKGGNI